MHQPTLSFTPPQRLRVAVAASDERSCDDYRRTLTSLGHEPVVFVQNGKAFVEQCLIRRPDLVITDNLLEELEGLEAAEQYFRQRPTPIVLGSENINVDRLLRALHEVVLAILPQPCGHEELSAAISLAVRRFQEFELLYRHCGDRRTAIRQRKMLQQTKAQLMTKNGLSEEAASQQIRLLARDTKQSLVDVALELIHSDRAQAA